MLRIEKFDRTPASLSRPCGISRSTFEHLIYNRVPDHHPASDRCLVRTCVEHTMKLINRDPRAYIGRTIFCKGGSAWQITSVDSQHVHLYKPGSNQCGLLLLHLVGQCTLFPTPDEIRTHFPMLLRALRTVCNLTSGEAENAVLGIIVNGPFFAGSEAVAHLGGGTFAVQRCWRFRRQVREYFARSPALAS